MLKTRKHCVSCHHRAFYLHFFLEMLNNVPCQCDCPLSSCGEQKQQKQNGGWNFNFTAGVSVLGKIFPFSRGVTVSEICFVLICRFFLLKWMCAVLFWSGFRILATYYSAEINTMQTSKHNKHARPFSNAKLFKFGQKIIPINALCKGKVSFPEQIRSNHDIYSRFVLAECLHRRIRIYQQFKVVISSGVKVSFSLGSEPTR